MIYGAAYYPEHRDPDRWDYDLDMMVAAHLNSVRIGEFAWKRFEPKEGQYDFQWLDTFIEKAAAHDIDILLCPPLRTAPAWLVEKDRNILMIDDRGVQLEFGNRYTFCINQPTLRETGLAIAAEMAERYATNPSIVGWHLDNEYGDEQDCFCSVCAERWRDWLRSRYADIDALNVRWGNVFWGLEFDDFRQIPMPSHTKTFYSPAHLLNWRRFRSDCTVEMIGLHADALRSRGADQPITTNGQVWNARTDYYQSAKHLDICGTNYYPNHGSDYRNSAFGLANTRGYRQQTFHVHELQNGAHGFPGENNGTPAPGEMERLVMHTIGNGADGIYYFRWRACPFGCEQTHGTLTDYDGQPMRIYDECQRTGRNLKRISGLLEGSAVKSEVGVLFDFETRWMMESGARWNGPEDLYMERCRMIYRAVRDSGVNCDSVGRAADLSRYKLLIVPFISAMTDELVEKLQAYVDGGGTLVCHPLSGTKNDDATFYLQNLHPGMGELLGISRRDFATSGETDSNLFKWNGKEWKCGMFLDFPRVETASIEAEYINCWFAGEAAMTSRALGNGRAVYVACLPDASFYPAFVSDAIEKAGVKRILGGTMPPSAVELCERTTPDGRRIVFLLNGSDTLQEVDLPGPMVDVWHEEDVVDSVSISANGIRILMD